MSNLVNSLKGYKQIWLEMYMLTIFGPAEFPITKLQSAYVAILGFYLSIWPDFSAF